MRSTESLQSYIFPGISLVMQADPQKAGVNYDKEFIVCSLDLLSGLAEGLGSSIESLVSILEKRSVSLVCVAADLTFK